MLIKMTTLELIKNVFAVIGGIYFLVIIFQRIEFYFTYIHNKKIK